MAICLPKEAVRRFRKGLKEKEIDISKLLNMETAERTALFERYVGKEHAKNVNLLFEEKLVLKNRMQGLRNWASKVGEIGRFDPRKAQQIKDAFSEYRELQQERILSPKENEAFLRDLAETKLGTRITEIEAKTLWGLRESAKLEKEGGYKPETENNFGEWVSEKAKNEHGAAMAAYERYLGELKTETFSLKELAKQYLGEKKVEFSENIPLTIGKTLADVIKTILDVSVNIVASWDNSFIGRQGVITLVRKPSVWWKTAKQSFKDIVDTFGEQKAQDALMADTFSRPNYIEGIYEKMGLEGFKKKRSGLLREEETPAINIVERIPFLGKVFKASDIAFNGSALRVRMDLADHFYKMYKSMGVEMTDAILTDIGKHVNAIAARGKMGRFGGSPAVNLILWAPRMLKADWDILTAHTLGAGLETNTMRLAAARTIGQVVIASAGAVAISEAINPGSVELDPRSSNFLRVQVGDTSIPVNFGRGMIQIVTLFARLLTRSSKSSRTGIVRELNSGEFGSQTLFDVGIDFLANKTQPLVNSAIRVLEGRTFDGEKPNLGNTLDSLTPITIQNIAEIKEVSGEKEKFWAAFGAFLDFFGVSARTFVLKDDWNQGITNELQEFKDQAGEETFEDANNEFNKRYNNWVKENVETIEYRKLTNEKKEDFIRKGKRQIKEEVLSEFGSGETEGGIELPEINITL